MTSYSPQVENAGEATGLNWGIEALKAGGTKKPWVFVYVLGVFFFRDFHNIFYHEQRSPLWAFLSFNALFFALNNKPKPNTSDMWGAQQNRFFLWHGKSGKVY